MPTCHANHHTCFPPLTLARYQELRQLYATLFSHIAAGRYVESERWSGYDIWQDLHAFAHITHTRRLYKLVTAHVRCLAPSPFGVRDHPYLGPLTSLELLQLLSHLLELQSHDDP